MHSFLADPFSALETAAIWRLIAAALLGALFGLERSISGKHAGMRTYGLVSVGSCLFIIAGNLGSYELSFFTGINPIQVASSVVLGIGFLGSGLAAFKHDHPFELTTAAGLWVTAGVGMACGFGLYELALAGTLIPILVLTVFMPIERWVRRTWGPRGASM